MKYRSIRYTKYLTQKIILFKARWILRLNYLLPYFGNPKLAYLPDDSRTTIPGNKKCIMITTNAGYRQNTCKHKANQKGHTHTTANAAHFKGTPFNKNISGKGTHLSQYLISTDCNQCMFRTDLFMYSKDLYITTAMQ